MQMSTTSCAASSSSSDGSLLLSTMHRIALVDNNDDDGAQSSSSSSKLIKLILASQSPRRRDIFDMIGLSKFNAPYLHCLSAVVVAAFKYNNTKVKIHLCIVICAHTLRLKKVFSI